MCVYIYIHIFFCDKSTFEVGAVRRRGGKRATVTRNVETEAGAMQGQGHPGFGGYNAFTILDYARQCYTIQTILFYTIYY